MIGVLEAFASNVASFLVAQCVLNAAQLGVNICIFMFARAVLRRDFQDRTLAKQYAVLATFIDLLLAGEDGRMLTRAELLELRKRLSLRSIDDVERVLTAQVKARERGEG